MGKGLDIAFRNRCSSLSAHFIRRSETDPVTADQSSGNVDKLLGDGPEGSALRNHDLSIDDPR